MIVTITKSKIFT